MNINDLQNAAIEAATQHIKGQREENRMAKIKLYCMTTIACVLIFCAAVVACFTIHTQHQTIIEQQYALNMQYAGLLDYVSSAEITREIAETGDGDTGTAFVGDGNTVVGGDLNG